MWSENKAGYIRNAGLENFTDCDAVLSNLENILDNQYHITNKNIIAEQNNHIRFNKENDFILQTPKVEKEASSPLSNYFPNNQYIPLLEVLHTINKEAEFSDKFEHWQPKYQRQKQTNSLNLGRCSGARVLHRRT